MPTIEVPLKPWTEIPALRKSKKFKSRGDEAIALTYVAKIVKARREELSLDLHDTLDDVLPEDVKSINFNNTRITREKILTILFDLIPDDVEITEGRITDRAAGESKKFDKKKLMEMPIPCSNPKCKTDNHVTADIIEACIVKGSRRGGVSIKLPGDSDEE